MFLTRFLKLSSTQSFFFMGEDFENVDVGNLVESWAGNLIENLVEIGLIILSVNWLGKFCLGCIGPD